MVRKLKERYQRWVGETQSMGYFETISYYGRRRNEEEEARRAEELRPLYASLVSAIQTGQFRLTRVVPYLEPLGEPPTSYGEIGRPK